MPCPWHSHSKTKPSTQGERLDRVWELCPDQTATEVVTGVKASRNQMWKPQREKAALDASPRVVGKLCLAPGRISGSAAGGTYPSQWWEPFSSSSVEHEPRGVVVFLPRMEQDIGEVRLGRGSSTSVTVSTFPGTRNHGCIPLFFPRHIPTASPRHFQQQCVTPTTCQRAEWVSPTAGWIRPWGMTQI